MRILIAAATPMEIAPLVDAFGGEARPDHLRSARYGGHEIDLLITGVGMVATAAWCARVLAESHYNLALNFGVCGSFDAALTPGTVVHVVSDRIAELGAEDGDNFLPIEELKLQGESAFTNATPPANAALRDLPAVSGITVNTVHGNEATIAAVVRRFKPQVESMEGAAFMSACLMRGLPFAQVRAVSNVVERRNRERWKTSEAITNLGRTALRILEQP
jgi:futalosine hydrolase